MLAVRASSKNKWYTAIAKWCNLCTVVTGLKMSHLAHMMAGLGMNIVILVMLRYRSYICDSHRPVSKGDCLSIHVSLWWFVIMFLLTQCQFNDVRCKTLPVALSDLSVWLTRAQEPGSQGESRRWEGKGGQDPPFGQKLGPSFWVLQEIYLALHRPDFDPLFSPVQL